MRCLAWTALVVLGLTCLTTPSLRSSATAAADPQPATGVRVGERSDDLVDGYGPTAAAARERALEHACRRVEKLLLDRLGHSGWQPRPEQLEPGYLSRYGVIQPHGEPEVEPRFKNEKVMVARYQVELTSDYLTQVQQSARLERVETRHLLLARGLTGLLALLLVTAGYLRLEEMTRGYATHLLRLAAAAVLALVAAVLWLTF